MLSNTEHTATIEKERYLRNITDYSELLRSFELNFKKADYYWQVGEITKIQGWILHISVVLSQIVDMLQAIVPILIAEGSAFKIVLNESTAEDLLEGNFGLAQIGKIVSIYPETDDSALGVAKTLVKATCSFKGPRIPTDICLGSIVYTRYGSFNPITKLDPNGNEEKYIYDAEGQLVKDSYDIPFQLPKEICWPFNELTALGLSAPPKFLNRLYKLTGVLKSDPRGNVFKGLYVKTLLQVKSCVVKQGFNNMSSDKAGRDMRDRLIWQNELHKELSGVVPLPTIYDLLEDQGFSALIMKFIKGDSLYDKLIKLNPLSKSWLDFSKKGSLSLLNYATNIALIIERMHKKGYVHRDIVPVNFLIDKKDRLFLIDIELAYSLKHNRPNPPFKYGTPGFMSPEQEAIQHPTVQEDIYGLGATLLYIFTGLFPVKFTKRNGNELFKSLNFFIGNENIASTISNCLHSDPKFRPSIESISADLIKYQRELKTNFKSAKPKSDQKLNSCTLEEIISTSLHGLIKDPIVVKSDLWYSKYITIENHTASKNKQYSMIPGICEGISGVLYVLARVHRTGISISPCNKGFIKGWEALTNKYFNRLSELSPGLYRGAAGLALALAESIRSKLLEENDTNRDNIQGLLSIKNEKNDLANGIAGQGLSILHCKSLLKEGFYHTKLNHIVGDLLNKQLKDGSWLTTVTTKNGEVNELLDIGYDDTGIIWFLLEYQSLYPSTEIKNATIKALRQLIGNNKCMKRFYDLVASKKSYQIGDGGTGLIMILIRAYEILHEDIYKIIAEKALFKYPRRIIHTNFSQENGLAGIGEIYLEAWRVFGNEEWKHRADWIANVFIHGFFRTDQTAGHWVMEQNNPPTADFLVGNSGIIHFLVRCLAPGKLAYRLLK